MEVKVEEEKKKRLTSRIIMIISFIGGIYFILTGIGKDGSWLLIGIGILFIVVGVITAVRETIRIRKEERINNAIEELAKYKIEQKQNIQQIVDILDSVVRKNTFYNILDKLEEFLDDKSIISICNNFVSENDGILCIDYMINFSNVDQPQHNCDGDVLDFPYITKERFMKYGEFKALDRENDIESIVDISTYAFKNDTVRWCNAGLARIISQTKKINELLDDEFEYEEFEDDEIDDNREFKIFEFINLLKNCNKINDEFVDEQAIMFLLWILHKVYLQNQLETRYDIYDINDGMSIEEKIEKIYLIDEEDTIAFLAIEKYLQELKKPLFLYSDKLREDIKPLIKKIKNNQALQRLENRCIYEKHLTIQEVDLMSGFEFERFVSRLFEKYGYKTEVTKSNGDQGIDVLAMKGDFVVAIQAKCYNGVVGNHAIMEAVAGMKYYNANKCMVVTNSSFSKSAKELAQVNNVELWDRTVLKEKIEEI